MYISGWLRTYYTDQASLELKDIFLSWCWDQGSVPPRLASTGIFNNTTYHILEKQVSKY